MAVTPTSMRVKVDASTVAALPHEVWERTVGKETDDGVRVVRADLLPDGTTELTLDIKVTVS